MGKKKANKKGKILPKIPATNSESLQIPDTLQLLAQKRVGGAVNFRGIHFQLLYASYILLTRLGSEGKSVRLEGVEDIDLYMEDGAELIQVKTSQNPLDAGRLWNMNVLQNFMEAFKTTPSLSFSMIHNTTLTKGKLQEFVTGNIAAETLDFWEQKFAQSGAEITREELSHFLGKVRIDATNENYLSGEINRILIERFNINIGTEQVFQQALFHLVFEASRNRSSLKTEDISALIQSVKDSFSMFPENPALKHKWITAVSYKIPEGEPDLGYYDGKAARPVDIARGLPVHRPDWETMIEKSIQGYDITLIKSSSGQGKSTLAWQIGYKFSNRSFSIYQLHFCTNYSEATSISDFVESRLALGQVPLLIMDGLNQNLSAWNELAKLLREKPVRIIITSREEDWIRFGDKLSTIVLNTIDIKVNVQEAAAIYSALKNNQKIHSSITAWQPAWEKVKDRGLMIEYIYLLTRGQMIAERLATQLNNIQHEPGSAAKLELLRLIAAADMLNIKLKTQHLTDYIRGFISIDIDRNELYRQLEKEYYLRFDKTYVEGLHRVRSEHLVSILHSHIPVQESLLSILKIIDDQSVYDFFIEAPLVFELSAKDDFYKSAAAIVAGKTIPEMVYAIDGLMHLEPLLYWKQNKIIFDEIFNAGGLELFISDSAPFNPRSSLQDLADSMGEDKGSTIFFLLKRKKDLSKYLFTDSILARFTRLLKVELEKRGEIENPEGIAFLYKWFKQTATAFPEIVPVNQEKLLYFLENKSISESSELFHFYSILNPASYRAFSQKYRDKIVGQIKSKTNTLTIEEKGNDIHINYLLDDNADKANEYSVYRINMVHSFFPFYEHYCTKAIILPFPNEEIYKVVLDNSTKRMKPGAWGDDFYIHINQIWARTILDQYGASSAYEWQKKHMQFREQCIDLVKKCTRLLEGRLENKSSQINSLTKGVVASATAFFNLDTVLPKHPAGNKKYFDEKAFAKEQACIGNWLFSFRNFINQFSGLINPSSDRDRHLPVINLQTAVFKLLEMQECYEKIRQATYEYFPTEKLCGDEQQWLGRLLNTVQFYVDQAKKSFSTTVVVASRSVAEWAQAETKRKLEELHEIISSFEEDSRFWFHLPTKIITEDILTTAVIGVEGCDVTNQEDLWELSTGLTELAKTDIHFFIFVWVNDEQQATGAMRLRKEYFEAFAQLLEGGDTSEIDLGNPLPQIPDEKMLATLEDITIKKIDLNDEDNVFFRMMMNVWKLTEYRNRLNPLIPEEKLWLHEIESEYIFAIEQDIPTALKNDEAGSSMSRNLLDKILKNETILSPQEISGIMTKKTIQMQAKSQL